MNNHRGKIIRIDNFTLQPFNETFSERKDMFFTDILELFSNKKVTEFNKNISLESEEEVMLWLGRTLNYYDTKEQFIYFVQDKKNKKVIGVISLITNTTMESIYPFIVSICQDKFKVEKDNVWGIEYYLNPEYWNKGIMKLFVLLITNELIKEGVKVITALTNFQNNNSISLLKKCGFTVDDKYKDRQNQTLWFKTK